MKRNKEILASLLMILFLGGCTFKDAPPVRTYTLDAGEVATVTASAYAHKVLKVAYPQTLKEKMTNKIPFSYGMGENGVYQNSEWSNTLPKLLQGSVIASLQQSGMFKAVLPYGSTVEEDLRLESIIYDFSHHIRGERSYAVVSVQFSLIDTRSGKLIGSKRFSYRENTPTLNAEGYVKASNRAMHRLVQDLILWLKSRA